MADSSTPRDHPPLAQERLGEARRLLTGASPVLVLTGAGVSVESGMPTFRGEDGLWKEHRAEDLATPAAFRRDPRLVWEWYAWRRRQARACEPNEAHLSIARWCLQDPDVTLVTQNVDGLHGRALESVAGEAGPGSESGPGSSRVGGASSRRSAADPVELHGNLFRARCTGCGERRPILGTVDASDRSTLPHCPDCGGLLRPDVVWFGESLDPGVLEASFRAARGAGAALVVGTSAAVQPAASLATEAAAGGAALVEVNPEETPVTRVASVVIRAGAARAVPALLDPLLRAGDDTERGEG